MRSQSILRLFQTRLADLSSLACGICKRAIAMLLDLARAGVGVHQRHVAPALLEYTLFLLAVAERFFFGRLRLLGSM